MAPKKSNKGAECPGAIVTGSCELSGVGAGDCGEERVLSPEHHTTLYEVQLS